MRSEPTKADQLAAQSLAQWNLVRYGGPLFCGTFSLAMLYGFMSTVQVGWIVGPILMAASLVLQCIGWSKELRAGQEDPPRIHGGVKWLFAAAACLLLGIFLPVGLV